MAIRVACPNANRYKALQPPKCGCIACSIKWLVRNVEELADFKRSLQDRELREREDYF